MVDAKAKACIFCSCVFFRSGDLKFKRGKENLKVCMECGVPKTEEDMELILEWEKETGKKVHKVNPDWNDIKKHFTKHKILEYIEKNPESDSEDVAKALNISDKLASDLTTELTREGALDV